MMKDGKFIHIHINLFINQFHHIIPCCKDLQQVAKFCVTAMTSVSNFCSLELAHQIYNQQYSFYCIFVIVTVFTGALAMIS